MPPTTAVSTAPPALTSKRPAIPAVALDVGWVLPGEWLTYTVNASTAGSYVLKRPASPTPRPAAHSILRSMVPAVPGSITVPNTRRLPDVPNRHVRPRSPSPPASTFVKLAMDTAGSNGFVGNFNWITFTHPPASRPPALTDSDIGGATPRRFHHRVQRLLHGPRRRLRTRRARRRLRPTAPQLRRHHRRFQPPITQVTSASAPSIYSHVGLMARDGPWAAQHAFFLRHHRKPALAVFFYNAYRTAAGAPHHLQTAAATASFPNVWLKIQRARPGFHRQL